MAYNLESLVKIIEQVMHPDNYRRSWTIDPNKKQEIESLLSKAHTLKKLFGNSSPSNRDKIESLESQIRDAAHEAEDILESHLVDRVRSVGEGVSFTFSPLSLEKVIGEFDSAEEEIKKMMDGSHMPESSSRAAASSRIDQIPKKILVGLSQDLIELKDRLTRPKAKLEIIPIVGMGGIGKTTLAQNVYDDPLVVSHFDTRAWVTISQEYNIRVILLGLLECVIEKLTSEMRHNQTDQLALHLYKSLYGRRYLIVLDDMWDDKSWDCIRMFFPDEENGSRVMVTTRELSVASYAGSNNSYHQMHLLNNDDSWNLLREKVFAQEICPPELETIGKRIAENCGGLPLAIHVIGGFLSQANRTKEPWVEVAKDVTTVVANIDEQFSKIFSLSYNHLPNHLKPCFLYLSAFPEDYEIRSSYLIRLWVAEAFVEPVSDQSLEETAETYLKSLVDRNLIFIRRKETKRIVKIYGMHDLLRDLCVKKASEEKFLYVKHMPPRNHPRVDALSLRRVSVDISYTKMESMPLARSFIWVDTLTVKVKKILSPVFFQSRLLRVLDLLGISFDEFPNELLQLINLRYLALACRSSLIPSSISTLWNLQTIIFQHISAYGNIKEIAIEAILSIPQLRHIIFKETHPWLEVPDGKSFVTQENLQTLSGIIVVDGFDRIIESLPNLKKLEIILVCDVSHSLDLTCLSKLETLKCSSNLTETSLALLSILIFPPSLKKLTLRDCRIPAGYMNKIGALPDLEVLRLRDCMLEGLIWEPTEGEFSKLQFLLLHNVTLSKWEADETNFPRLQRLVIAYCSGLQEIPLGIGETPTLEIIEVYYADHSVVASARKIQEEQHDLGNDDLRVYITEIDRARIYAQFSQT